MMNETLNSSNDDVMLGYSVLLDLQFAFDWQIA